MSTCETNTLLKETLSTTPQAFATKVKAPCTGFCYLIIKNLDIVINLYETKDKTYGDFILGLIIEAANRKAYNQEIDKTGEYINGKTIYNDFPEIVNNMEFQEFNTVDQNGSEYAINTLFLLILDLPLNKYVIITRSQETFLIIKLPSEKLLIVDSHKAKHGIVDLEGCIKYITRFGIYKGLIQIGYLK